MWSKRGFQFFCWNGIVFQPMIAVLDVRATDRVLWGIYLIFVSLVAFSGCHSFLGYISGFTFKGCSFRDYVWGVVFLSIDILTRCPYVCSWGPLFLMLSDQALILLSLMLRASLLCLNLDRESLLLAGVVGIGFSLLWNMSILPFLFRRDLHIIGHYL